jgi:hypothetical protein
VKLTFRAFLEPQKRWTDRVYQRTDARGVSFRQGPFDYRIPGVANEFWPVRDIPPGGENYGWGATLPMNIIRSIIGFREESSPSGSAFTLAPALPPGLMLSGKAYTIKGLHYRGSTFDITYRCGSTDTINVSMRVRSPKPVAVAAKNETNAIIARTVGKVTDETVMFTATNGQVLAIQWE